MDKVERVVSLALWLGQNRQRYKEAAARGRINASMGYAHSLGTTLLELSQNDDNNATVAQMPYSISLILRLLLPTSCVPFGHVDFEAQASKHLSPLLQHVATSSTLRRIVLNEKPRSMYFGREDLRAASEYLVTTFLDAMSSNPSIDTVELSCPVPASVFGRYATATKATLKILVMDLEPLRNTPAEALKSMTDAFQAMNAEESLTILGIADGHLGHFVSSSLESISVGCFVLRELKLLAGCRDFRKHNLLWNQLAKLCQRKSHQRPLQHLDLHKFHFEKDGMEGLVKCLKCPVDNHGDVQPLPVPGIAKLSLPNCCILNDAWRVLVKFLRTTSRHSSALRELHGVKLDTLNNGYYENQRSITRLLGAFELANRGGGGGGVAGDNRGRSSTIHVGIDSIGSHLHALSVDDFTERSCADLMRLFSTQPAAAGLIQLQCLSITNLDSYYCDLLRDYLVNAVLPSLRQLHLSATTSRDVSEREIDDLVDMMRRNGNICQFTATGKNDKALFSPSQQRRVDAYCQRNAFLLELANKNHDDPNATESAGNRMDPAQYAMLLRVARQV